MSEPTFPCEVCGAFHSASEIAEAGGYCPQCEADYDERTMLADLVQRYAKLEAELAALKGQEPVATIQPQDPYDERFGLCLALGDIERLSNLPAGTKLYASPVAQQRVVMPERRRKIQAGISLFDVGHADGWNACLEEITRLNRSKNNEQ